jgi:serine/threonine-protein kinase
VTLPFLQKRSLTTGGSIAVSALTAGVVAGLALAFHAWRQPAPAVVATSTREALVPAAAPPAGIALSAAPASPVVAAPPARAPEQAAPPAPGELPPGYGRLTVQSTRDADVYLTGKRAGPANGPLDVRCGTWFVRLARPGEDFPPEWVGAGETVRVACQAATTVELGPAQSSTLVLKRPAR